MLSVVLILMYLLMSSIRYMYEICIYVCICWMGNFISSKTHRQVFSQLLYQASPISKGAMLSLRPLGGYCPHGPRTLGLCNYVRNSMAKENLKGRGCREVEKQR